MTYAQEERAALAALLEETGPDGPTLCEGWQTKDLAAHLVLRERRPDAAAGVMGGPLAGYTARVQRKYLGRYSYPELVGLFRSGPPALSLFAIPGADEAANAVEYFVHHEDVRRAGEEWTERTLDDGLSEMLWKRLKGAQLLLRSAPTGIVFAREGNGKLDLIVAKNAAPSVTVTGSPAELTLWSMGRARAAHVTLDGLEEAVAKLTAWRG
ncbi:MAG TPA: TIGR03085 family metal-binding protein [Trebonia sp.]